MAAKNRLPFQVIGTGLVAVDVLWRAPENIVRGQKHEAPDMVLQGGAPAASSTCQLGRLGYRSAFLACVGDGTLSNIAIEEFRRCGVSPDLFVKCPDASPALALCEVDPVTAERTVYYNLSNYQNLRPEDLPVEVLRQADLLILDSFEIDATESILHQVKDFPVKTLLDLEHGPTDQIKRCLRQCTDAVLPWATARELTAASSPALALEQLSEWTKANLLVTNGPEGSWAWTSDGILHQPAFPVSAVDTTGCGDAYHGGYGVGLLEGWPLRVRMEYGAWIASLVATALGGRTRLPDRQALGSLDTTSLSAETRRAVLTLAESSSAPA